MERRPAPVRLPGQLRDEHARPDPAEAGVARLALELYTRDRHGARTIASALNDRGHRTTTGGTWSAHQVVRVLSNRVYLGELTVRGITTTGCHLPIIENGTFADAQRILAARGEDYSKRAGNGSDYLLTGLMRCQSCGKAMVGTRAHGRSRVYRYHTCFTRLRYEAARCDAARLDADAVEDAVIAALAGFYRHQHALIADAIAQAHASHAASEDSTNWQRRAPRSTATWPPSSMAPWTQKTSPSASPSSRPGHSSCAPATMSSRRRSPRRQPRRQRPPSGRSPSTSKTSSAQARATSARPSSKPS